MTEHHKRTLARAISYRFIALLITIYWTGIAGAIILHVILTLVHYVHERAWMRIKWGRKHA